jgi:hypothetical protein
MLDDAVDADANVCQKQAMRPCEVAQVALFAATLDAEIADLRARVEAAEQRWEQRQLRASPVELEVPEGLVRLRDQLDEATGLLDRCGRVAKP